MYSCAIGNTVMNSYMDNNIQASQIRNGAKSFEDCKDTIMERINGTDNNALIGATTGMMSGDMVLSYPPSLISGVHNSIASDKPRSQMSMDEYKQWVMNEISQMPVSSWVRSSFSSGSIVITEKAFERMKSDPEWEKYVLNRVRSAYSVNSFPVGSNHVGYDVIGASPEECYGYAGPIGNNSSKTVDKEETWWKKRHERMEQLLEEQIEKGQNEKIAKQKNIYEEYKQQIYTNQQRVFNLLNSSLLKEDVNSADVITQSVMATVTASYEKSSGNMVNKDFDA